MNKNSHARWGKSRFFELVETYRGALRAGPRGGERKARSIAAEIQVHMSLNEDPYKHENASVHPYSGTFCRRYAKRTAFGTCV
jgi:hypothetical protein